jgi:hypothetical protein
MGSSLPKRAPRDGVTEIEAAVARREFHRLVPGDTVAFSNKVPLPAWSPRGGYVVASRSQLQEVRAGLERLIS